MNTHVLMIVLTTLGGGDLSAAFVGTESPADCRERLERVRLILDGAAAKGGASVASAGCYLARQRFSAFSHGEDASDPIHHYRIALSGETAVVTRHESAAACRQAAAAEGGQQHCAQSRQTMREDDR